MHVHRLRDQIYFVCCTVCGLCLRARERWTSAFAAVVAVVVHSKRADGRTWALRRRLAQAEDLDRSVSKRAQMSRMD